MCISKNALPSFLLMETTDEEDLPQYLYLYDRSNLDFILCYDQGSEAWGSVWGGGGVESGQQCESWSVGLQGCGSELQRRGWAVVRVMPQTKVTAHICRLLMWVKVCNWGVNGEDKDPVRPALPP